REIQWSTKENDRLPLGGGSLVQSGGRALGGRLKVFSRTPLAVLFAFAVAVGIPAAAQAASLESWPYRKQITISNTNVDADLTDFPVLVRITADADIATHAQGSGADLRFSTSTGMVLPYEREDYHVSSGSGSGLFWVKVPKIKARGSSSSGAVLYVLFGSGSAADGQTKSTVWESGFKGVWHFGTSDSLLLTDSTTNTNNGTNYGATAVAGTVGGAAKFSGAQYVNCGTGASLNFTGDFTLEAWITPTNPPLTNQALFGKHTSSSVGYWMYYNRTEYPLTISLLGVNNTSLKAGEVSGGETAHVVGIRSGTTLLLYVNGTFVDSLNPGGSVNPTSNNPFTIGKRSDNASYYYKGGIDEIRVSSAARSAAWVKFEYQNMASGSGELAIGSLAVNQIATTTTFVSSLNPSVVGQSVTFTATVSPSTATGAVTFKDGETTLDTVVLGQGSGSYTTSALTTGSHTITAEYETGNAKVAGSTSSLTQVVTGATPSSTALASSQNPSGYGQSVTFTATVTPSDATGTVTFKDGATTLATATVTAGVATYSVSTLPVTTHSVTAQYGGDGTYMTSTSDAVAQTVTQAASTTTLTSSLNPSTYGSGVTLTATVSPSTATGTITFKDGSVTLDAVTLAQGSASYTTSSLWLGSHTITAEYGGNVNVAGGTSDSLTQTVRSPYSAFTANSDLVKVAPYATISETPGSWGLNAAGFREFLSNDHRYRIRQNGTVTRVRLYTGNKTNLTGFYVIFWRKDGTTYDRVGMTENLVDDLVAGATTAIDLATPIDGIQEGDFVGYRIEKSGDGYNFNALTASSYYVTDADPSATDYAWESQASLPSALPIEIYMQAPQFAFIGDSIMAGHPSHYSFIESTNTTSIASTIERQFADLTCYTYQNMGIGSQTATQIAARFNADIVASKPRVAVAEGGINGPNDEEHKPQFLADWQSMLDAAQQNGITLVALKILPCTSCSNDDMHAIDDWNSSLATLAAGYSNALVVDASSYVGQFRSGGDAGNLWDIQPAYNQDGVHFKQAGHAQIAEAIVDALRKARVTVTRDSDSSSSYGQSVTFTATVAPLASGADTPTGTITFKDGEATLETVALGQGSGSYTTSALSVGSHSITAEYDGDSIFFASGSTALAHSVTSTAHGAAAANAAREKWWQEYVQELERQATISTGNGAQGSSSSTVASSTSSSSSDPYRLLRATQESSASSAAAEGMSSSSAAISVQAPSRTERICARVDRWIPVDSPRRASVLRRLLKWLGIACGE
ncbi:MAG: DUF2341 domain-containing protein, partial [Candidatus Peribacteraceae bacterium]|nr:DUF2341 domain-containing protein [Candidatus Peribacteraceae bacterium]